MTKYKIEVHKMGAYVAYLYKRRFFFWWKLVANAIDNHCPYSHHVIKWQSDYNIPDKKVRFYISNSNK